MREGAGGTTYNAHGTIYACAMELHISPPTSATELRLAPGTILVPTVHNQIRIDYL